MTGLILNREEIQLVQSTIAKAVEYIDSRTTLDSTDAELQLLGRERNRLDRLYEKFENALLSM
mgnify:FL=1